MVLECWVHIYDADSGNLNLVNDQTITKPREPIPIGKTALQVVGLTLLGLGGNFVAMAVTGAMIWIGGPLFWYGQYTLTLVVGVVSLIYFLVAGRRYPFNFALPLSAWVIGMALLLFIGDSMEVRRYQAELVQLYSSTAGEKIPAACQPGLPWRAAPYIAFTCNATIGEVVSDLQANLGAGWKESDKLFPTVASSEQICHVFTKGEGVNQANVFVYTRHGETEMGVVRGERQN